MTDPDTMRIVTDLMSKARTDSEISLSRNIDLIMSTVGKDHIFNIVRAGLTPYLQLLLEIFPPHMVAAHVTYMILQMKHIDGGGKNLSNYEDAKNMSEVIMDVLKPVMDNITENFPNYKPKEKKKYRDRD